MTSSARVDDLTVVVATRGPSPFFSAALSGALAEHPLKVVVVEDGSQGVFQVTPRDSTEVSDYGISDTSSREKDVNAVVSATFDVKR